MAYERDDSIPRLRVGRRAEPAPTPAAPATPTPAAAPPPAALPPELEALLAPLRAQPCRDHGRASVADCPACLALTFAPASQMLASALHGLLAHWPNPCGHCGERPATHGAPTDAEDQPDACGACVTAKGLAYEPLPEAPALQTATQLVAAGQ